MSIHHCASLPPSLPPSSLSLSLSLGLLCSEDGGLKVCKLLLEGYLFSTSTCGIPCIEMNGVYRNEKNGSFKKSHPGCLGRMVNLFDLNIGMSTNKLLSDRPHQDGFPLSRSRSDVSRMSPSEDAMDEKVIVTDAKNGFSNRKANVTSMKMLIDKEMSKEVESRREPPNLVAKLMGLDALPRQEPDLTTQRSHSRGHPRSHSDIPMSCWAEQNGVSYVDPNEYKDVFEIWQQSQKGRYKEALNDEKMALVRQKFMEAKRMSTNESLRQSKQFQDALEVLSSNKDLFLKCLQEPNSMFTQHLYGRQSVYPPEAKRITVLKPSRMADSNEFAGGGNKDRKQNKKVSFLKLNGSEKIHPGSSPPSLNYCENPSQTTRIVVLKPSLGKPYDAKAVGSPLSETPMVSHSGDFFEDVEDENQESREVAKAITQEMRDKFIRHHTDETLISSILSNGYVGDESSFNKSEIDYVNGNHSDSEVMSPISRHSWDYADRLGSPYASSSFSHASHSPESSVCREAKKRLSERWAMMASTGSSQEQRHVRRSSSTLGEMLALSEAKKADSTGEESGSSEGPKDVNALLVGDKRREKNVDSSPRNLIRSKSVPVSSTEIGDSLNVGVSADKQTPKSPKEDKKASSSKTSFKGKVSSFFFSRNKKPVKEKILVSETKDEFQALPGEIGNDRAESFHEKGSDHTTPGLLQGSAKASSSDLDDKQDMIFPEAELAMEKPVASRNLGENQDQPSPVSVLDQPFEEDEHTAKVFPHYSKLNLRGIEPPINSIGSNLIDKSPHIGSIARTLSWDDDSCLDTSSSHPTAESSTTQETEDDDHQEWYFFVKTLLCRSGLQDEEASNSFLARWHSPRSPLDPSLRDNYIEPKDEETIHEAKRRHKWSTQKLIFDCVNKALADISIPIFGAQNCTLEHKPSSLVEKVWAQINDLLPGDVRCVLDVCGDDYGLLVERLVRKDVEGRGWLDSFRLETDCLRRDVEEMLLEELLHESVAELF